MKDIRIAYEIKPTAKYIAQHNYWFPTHLEIDFKGWHDTLLMQGCKSIVAVWRIKTKS